eukprot:363145-Chlamydomonas_euryale.AAC.1
MQADAAVVGGSFVGAGKQEWQVLKAGGPELNFGIVMSSTDLNVTEASKFMPAVLELNGVMCSIPQPCEATLKLGRDIWTDPSFG